LLTHLDPSGIIPCLHLKQRFFDNTTSQLPIYVN
jgi:hypothetical protein